MKLFGNNQGSKFSGDGKRSIPEIRTSGDPETSREASRQETPEREAPTQTMRRPAPVSAARQETLARTAATRSQGEPRDRSGISEDLYQRTHDKRGRRKKSKKQKRKQWITAAAIVLAVLIAGYCIFVFAPIPGIRDLRDMYVATALRTGSHQWLATAFIPKYICDEIRSQWDDIYTDKYGFDSTDPVMPTLSTAEAYVWPSDTGSHDPVETQEPMELIEARRRFYELFTELDIETTEAYFKKYPQYLADGYDNVKINEAGLKEDGLELETKLGEQVLAIDTVNKVLILREKGDTYRGVLAICKDASRLQLCPAKLIGNYGEHIHDIATRYDGLVAMTGSGFNDEGGNGSGGDVAGFCRCMGKDYGKHYVWGYWRLELRENNWLYVRSDTTSPCFSDTTDAMEFQPALIVNGYDMGSGGYFELNPRACLGQASNGDILMIVTEGRFLDSPGCSVSECTKILLQHDCITAMNMDGGTSAILWYDGEPITRCSNTRTPEGRYLPNAWVFTKVAD